MPGVATGEPLKGGLEAKRDVLPWNLKDEKIGRMRHAGAWVAGCWFPFPAWASSIRETLHELVTADACANRTPALSCFDTSSSLILSLPIYAFIFQM